MGSRDVRVVRVMAVDVGRDVGAWKAAHPGFDATNYVDAFRDGSGALVETDEFIAACDLFALWSVVSAEQDQS